MPRKRKVLVKKPDVGNRVNLKTSSSSDDVEEDYFISSPYSNKALLIKPEDIKQKMIIALNITQECKNIKAILQSGKSMEGKFVPSATRLSDFTNVPATELKEICNGITTRDRSFQKALKDIRLIPDHTAALIADNIRSIFVNHIVEKKQFPSKTDLLKDLKELSSKYTNEIIPIQRLVKNKMIKYQHFPEFNRYLLTEHPERTYKRTVYLNKVKDLRALQKNFVYVEIRRIIQRGSASGFIAGLVSFPSIGKLEKFFTKDSTEPIAKKWLQQRIIPMIPENSVVILSQPKILKDPSPMAKRSELLSWLDQNEIPYGINSHTAELYNLYNKFKGKIKKQGAYDHVFFNAGVGVIPFRDEWTNLNFFNAIWTDLTVLDSYHTGRPELLKQKILNATQMLTDLNDCEEKLIERELKMMKEDSAMEDIIENVLEMVKNGDIQLQDFPKECVGDKTDRFEVYVSNVVLDI